MRRQHRYFVYIMSSETRVLYIGMTSNLEQRVAQHKDGHFQGFSAKYRTRKLVYFEEISDVREAIDREHQLKRWVRAKKLALIDRDNPGWCDLSDGWQEGSGVGL